MDTGYEAGVRGLKQIWRSMYARAKLDHLNPLHLPGSLDDRFEQYTARFLDRQGFAKWYK